MLRLVEMAPTDAHDLEKVTGTADTTELVKSVEALMLGPCPNGSLTRKALTHALPWAAKERAEWYLGVDNAELVVLLRRRVASSRVNASLDDEGYATSTFTNWVKVFELRRVELDRTELDRVELDRVEPFCVEFSRRWLFVVCLATFQGSGTLSASCARKLVVSHPRCQARR